MRTITVLTALSLTAVSATAMAQADQAAQQAAANRVPDTPGTGAYPSTMEIDPAMSRYVVYRPADLSKVAAGSLGVVIWGNGGCADDGASSRQHLSEIASHGYLVIAPGLWRSGPNAKAPAATPRGPGPDGAFPEPPTSADDLRRALDWAVAENDRAGSRYRGKIDSDAIAVAGFSCGGAQAIDVAPDPRIDTVVIQNSGLFNAGGPARGGSMGLGKDALRGFHTPVLYLLGGPTDIAYANGVDDYGRIDQVPIALASIPTRHGGTYHEPNGGKAARIVVDWLEWQLRGDSAAGSAFLGDDCGLCRDPEVELRRKKLE